MNNNYSNKKPNPYYRTNGNTDSRQPLNSQNGINRAQTQNNPKANYYRVPPQNVNYQRQYSNKAPVQNTGRSNAKKPKNSQRYLKIFVLCAVVFVFFLLILSKCNNTEAEKNTETETETREVVTEKATETEKQTENEVTPVGASVKICIDPGHGYDDPGTGSESKYMDGTYEKDINLAIGLKVFNLLSENGYNVIITRENDEKPAEYGDAQYLFGVKKRMEWVKAQGDVECLVSVHCNSYPADETISGIRVYYCNSNGEKSKSLAVNISNGVRSSLGLSYSPTVEGYDYDNAFYVTKAINIPAVLIEVGFVTNKEDVANMKSEAWQEKIAEGIYQGILDSIS